MKKILQIIPADSWEAKFKSSDGELVGNDHIVCFALVEDDDGSRSVEGMIAAEGFMDFCEDIANFNGYVKSVKG